MIAGKVIKAVAIVYFLSIILIVFFH
jgi:hypothetical protein